jgi:hypothetical protein
MPPLGLLRASGDASTLRWGGATHPSIHPAEVRQCRRPATPSQFQAILFSAAPLHFLSNLRDDVCARGFL